MENVPQNPLVSVVITTYNRSKVLRDRAVKSIQDQTFKDWECIVVDDGSTDDTEAVVKTLSAADPRIKYLKKKNGGPAAARNFGVRNASGEYVAFIDDDDAYLPGYLTRAVEVFKTLPPDVGFISGGGVNIDDKGLRGYVSTPVEPVWCSPIGNGWIFRKSAFSDHNVYFDEELKDVEDLDLHVSFYRAGCRGYVFDEPSRVYYMNLSDNSGRVSANYKLKGGRLESLIRKNWDAYQAFGDKAMAWLYFGCGLAYLRGGFMKEGRRFLRRSFRLDPTLVTFVYFWSSFLGARGFHWFDSSKTRVMRLVRSFTSPAPANLTLLK